MAFSFTLEQEKVLQARKHNILVSAAAGSGKTAVLVERIIRMISEGEHPLDIDRLLVVTFTRAAAAQMRERISAAIADRLAKDPGNEHLQRQETLMHGAQITTIDSFCTVVVRNQFSEIGLDPAFRQMDEDEAKLLRADVMDAYMEQLHEEADPAFLDCLAFFARGGADTKLADHMLELYDRAVSHPDPREWLEERSRDYAVLSPMDLLGKPWLQQYLTGCLHRVHDLMERYEALLPLCEEPGGPLFYADVIRSDLALMRRILLEIPDSVPEGSMTAEDTAVLWEALRKLSLFSFGKLPAMRGSAAKNVIKEKQEPIKDLHDDLKKKIISVCSEAAVSDPETEFRSMLEISPRVHKLAELTIGFMDAFAAAKKEENLIDFSDLEHFALQILAKKGPDGEYRPRRAALVYRNHFEEILIDEYQDSNDVQEILLQIISTEEEGRFNRFMVGDVKQSIYKFRQARPEIFMDKYARYQPDDLRTERIDLDRNFRSRAEVLDAVNGIFSRVMTREIGGVQYDNTAALKKGSSYPEPEQKDLYRTELLLVDSGEAQEDLSARKREALLVAGKIRQLVGTLPVAGEDGLRPLRYGDIVILMRSPGGRAEEFRKVLESQGIPVYVESRTGYFAAQEIRVVLQLLQVLDNPMQDIPLYGVLQSYFGGFSLDEAAQLRVHAREGKLYEALLNCSEETAEGGILAQKARGFIDFINVWRGRRQWLSIHALLDQLLEETGYEDYCRALPGGEQRGANLYLLKMQAASFDRMAVSGLFSFVRYIEQIRKREMDYGEANVAADNADTVRIMSIHKSKGLEFPVCFVCCLAGEYSFRYHDTRGSFVVDSDLGIGTDLYRQDPGESAPTLRCKAAADKIGRDALGEELRVLYVAMTRAKEKLILTAAPKDTEKTLKSWTDSTSAGGSSISAVRIAETKSYLDLIGLALGSLQARDSGEKLIEITCLGAKETEEMLAGGEKAETLAGSRDSLEVLENAIAEGGLNSLPDPQLAAVLAERFQRRYAGEDLDGVYTMTSVSELKKAAMQDHFFRQMQGEEGETETEAAALFPEQVITPTIPFFAKEETAEEPGILRGAEFGTAVHRLMELFPFDKYAQPSGCSAQELKEWFEKLAEEGRIPEIYAREIRPAVLLTFLSSPLAGRMAAAAGRGKLFREQPFVLGVSADRLSSTSPKGEIVMVQGIIDAFFEEKGELVLVDYKTDRVDTAEELADRYRVQADYYAEALARITGKNVREKILYSFFLRKEVVLK